MFLRRSWRVCQNIAFGEKTSDMKIINLFKIAFIATIGTFLSIPGFAMVKVISAESVYGVVAKEIGGPEVAVMSILNSPTQDPHLFSTTPSTAKAMASADLIIYNGLDYDPWMESLLKLKGKKNRKVINVSSLIPSLDKENPHIWYFPETIPLFAAKLTEELISLDSAHEQKYRERLKHFLENYVLIYKKIAELKKEYQGTLVIATEPVYGYMVKSIGLNMQSEDFQINMMNDIPPTISQIKIFENNLRERKVRVFIFNNQVKNPLTERLRAIAQQEGIPIVGVSETILPDMTYIQWMLMELQALQNALAKAEGNYHE